MLGLSGWAVPLGFILMLLSAVLCIIYGIINWNKGYIMTDEEFIQEQAWAEEERKVEETL
ncbi:symporter small accessory protein [Geovibrio ferrireducens]|uniref:symporter small accessory protein n=1 Tax=Geovibrio ferrireducens TaxID=46201 RepID=UPI002245D6CB|nr:symporter small accessory protein [Geovibrio ferrireducens]